MRVFISIKGKVNLISMNSAKSLYMYFCHVVSFEDLHVHLCFHAYNECLNVFLIIIIITNVGDIVGVFSKGKGVAEKTLSGVVTAIKSTSVSVAFDELPDTIDLSDYNGSLQLVKLCNDVTYQRIRKYVIFIHLHALRIFNCNTIILLYNKGVLKR